jgi:hypothetical protein
MRILRRYNMTYRLFLDDLRMPPDRTWVVCRSVAAAKQYIADYGWPAFVTFDHDLGMASAEEAPTGYDFAKWLCEQDQESPWMAKSKFWWYVHSANPVGAANINSYLRWYMAKFVIEE